MTGSDLRQILVNKWGRSYDLQIRRTQGKIFVQVMWKYLEQASFPLSEGDYVEHLDQVAGYITAWGAIGQVQTYIEKTRERPRLGESGEYCDRFGRTRFRVAFRRVLANSVEAIKLKILLAKRVEDLL